MGTPEVKDPRQLDIFGCRGSVCDDTARCAAAKRCTYISSAEKARLEVEKDSTVCCERACHGFPCSCKMNPTPTTSMILPVESAARKAAPITTGVLDYFPLAIAAVARLSKQGNDKHNPGQALHWSRAKSQDHADCIPRHLIDRGVPDPDSGELHEVSLAWRALALCELAEEARLGKGPSRGSR